MKWPWTKPLPQLPTFVNVLTDAERDDETLMFLSDHRGAACGDYGCIMRLANQGLIHVTVNITAAGTERVRRLMMPVGGK